MPLGELIGATQRWFGGGVAIETPPATLIGEADCFTLGEKALPPNTGQILESGFDARCWENVPASPDLDIWDWCNITSLASICETLYGDADQAAVDLAAWQVGAVDWSSVTDGAGAVPGHAMAWGPRGCTAVISGTSNATQWILHAVGAAASISEVGQFGTNPLWWFVTNTIAHRLSLGGLPADVPILFVGHSYGGAIACLLAAMLQLATPARSISLLTFGCPAAGDGRLAKILTGVRQHHVSAKGDLVPYLPPTPSDVGYAEALIPGYLRRRWNLWAKLQGRSIVTSEPSFAFGELPFPNLFAAAAYVAAVLASDPVNFGVQHLISNYQGVTADLCGST